MWQLEQVSFKGHVKGGRVQAQKPVLARRPSLGLSGGSAAWAPLCAVDPFSHRVVWTHPVCCYSVCSNPLLVFAWGWGRSGFPRFSQREPPHGPFDKLLFLLQHLCGTLSGLGLLLPSSREPCMRSGEGTVQTPAPPFCVLVCLGCCDAAPQAGAHQ